ncbi:MAG: hypothetical protein AABZ10_01640 [Nitrospirota bacterium]
MALYIILAAVLVMALFALIVSYREDHPQKEGGMKPAFRATQGREISHQHHRCQKGLA